MSRGDKYLKIVEWSDEDGCFIGSCPELCNIIEETILIYEKDGKQPPTAMSGSSLAKISKLCL
ncbi:MAG: hypothetical protein WC647_01405 [Desulfomonilaceae bacterium]|jgi:hypothetical protein